MKKRVVIGGRYQYSPLEILKETSAYTQYRAYDKVTRRDLELQIHKQNDQFVESLRDTKSPFVQTVFDIVQLEDVSQVAMLYESGVQASLDQILRNNHYIKQFDAMVILKCIILGIKSLHDQMIICNRICSENVLFCTYSIIRFGFNRYLDIPQQTQAPEVLREERPSFASDVYSLGVVLYKMLYGCYPFEGDDQSELLSNIKSKKMKKPETVSPLKIVISRQAHFLLTAMLDYYPENRPSIENLLDNNLFSFHVQTEMQQYIKPKASIIPQPFLKKYLVFRASRLIDRVDEYYEEASYLALNIMKKQFMTMYAPDVRMFEADPRKIQSYFEKLRAMKEAYTPDNCSLLCRIDDYERFRREPILVTQYCNHGDLYNYLKQREKVHGWLEQKQVNIIMYLLALGYKQIRDIGVTSIHTIHSRRIMIKDKNIKIREPGVLTPYIQAKLSKSLKIDYFAPELKNKSEFSVLDKSDMWSYGVLYYYLLSQQLPELENNQEDVAAINIQRLQANRKNKNLIAKCLNPQVQRRIDLKEVKIEKVDEQLLEDMLEEKFEDQNIDDDEESENQKHLAQKNVIFKSRKKKWCKHYNKIIAYSSTACCRITIKILLGLILFWILSFGLFFVNGGIGLLRTNYYRPITLSVPYNYGTQLYQLTILSTNGKQIAVQYADYSYQQFTIDLNCTQNQRKFDTGTNTTDNTTTTTTTTTTTNSTNSTTAAPLTVNDYINGVGHSIQCLFGFVFMILFSIIYGAATYKLDLPRVMILRKRDNTNDQLYHFILMYFMYCGMLFCFFYIFALEYQIQMQPCLGLENQEYPLFTSIETLLSGQIGQYFARVFPTVILWSMLMIVFNFVMLFNKKAKKNIFAKPTVITTIIIMLAYTVICRIGFGGSIPLQPTWTYKINLDLVSQYWGLFGLFPEILVIIVFVIERLVDLIFWFFLRLGMQPQQQADIRRIQMQMRLEPQQQKLDNKQLKNQSKLDLIGADDFQIFD